MHAAAPPASQLVHPVAVAPFLKYPALHSLQLDAEVHDLQFDEQGVHAVIGDPVANEESAQAEQVAATVASPA